jgi:hypothetical protein
MANESSTKWANNVPILIEAGKVTVDKTYYVEYTGNVWKYDSDIEDWPYISTT